jgi:hypothetical protein
VRALHDAEARPLLREAGEAHGEIETLLGDADDAQERGDEAALDALVDDLRDEVETHVEEEEDELLPLAEERLGEDRLADLGRRMLSMKPAVPA